MITSRFARTAIACFSAASAIVACRSKEPSSQTSAGGLVVRPGAESTAMPMAGGMAGHESTGAATGMPGTSCVMGTTSGKMMDSMHSAMHHMSSTPPQQMAALLPAHRKMVEGMLSQMGGDTGQMSATAAAAAWKATADSVRTDLDRLPLMTPPELKRAMPGHEARVMRLMKMHRQCPHTAHGPA